MAVGMAIAERHLNAEFGDDLVDHRTWVVAGDGCLMEGINHEAVGLAGHLKLGRLIVFWDDNRITIDGATSLSTNEDIPARYAASHWHVEHCDGHDHNDISRAIKAALEDDRPSLIACRTLIGKGAPNKQGTKAPHGSPLGKDEIAATRVALDWPYAPFEMPDDILAAWRATGARGAAAHAEWGARLQASADAEAFEKRMGGVASDDWLAPHLQGLIDAPQSVATRKASELALTAATAALPQLLGGSADLTGSNFTKTASTPVLDAENYGGRYVNYGIREFGMAAAMNGMALHGGIIPYGGTFLIFSDYCRAAIRLSALQEARIVYVMTHDSIGVGEDGPTHQPIEQIMSLRLVPNLDVYRPCDAIETAECWALAIAKADGPSLLALSRQNLPQLRDSIGDNLSARGGYRLRAAGGERQVVLIATGSEVSLAVAVADALAVQGIGADVVSMPCWERFDAQPSAYREDVLGSGALRVSIEAGTTMGWERYVGGGLRIGIDSFGASGPIDALYAHFGLTAVAIVPKIIDELQRVEA